MACQAVGDLFPSGHQGIVQLPVTLLVATVKLSCNTLKFLRAGKESIYIECACINNYKSENYFEYLLHNNSCEMVGETLGEETKRIHW
jgi:hypothetical protein